MDDLVERVAEAVCKARCYPGRPDAGKGLDEFIAKAIIPLVYEDAAKVVERIDEETPPYEGLSGDGIAKAIRSRSMTIVGES